MPALARQRCLNHPGREAAARCLECGRFYCRECVTEHDDRIICAACLQKAAGAHTVKRTAFWRSWILPLAGLLIAWISYYEIGRYLISEPSEFHALTLWKEAMSGGSEE